METAALYSYFLISAVALCLACVAVIVSIGMILTREGRK